MDIIARSFYDLPLLPQTVIGIPDLGSVNITVNHFNIKNMRIGTDEQLIILGEDNMITLNLKNLTGEMNASYMYITDPPVFPDVGDFDCDFNSTDVKLGFSVYLTPDYIMQTKLGEF